MMTRLTLLVWALILNSQCSAGTHYEAKIALHIEPYSKGSICSHAPTRFTCDSPGCQSCMTVDAEFANGTPYYVYAVVVDFDAAIGLGGVTFGLDSGGQLQITSWANCADHESPSTSPEWPTNGSWNSIQWDPIENCQQTVDSSDPQGQGAAVAYGFYVYTYAPDVLEIVPGSGGDSLSVSDCEGNRTDMTWRFSRDGYFGKIGFGYPHGIGNEPCCNLHGGPIYTIPRIICDDEVSVKRSTWGGIKQRYKEVRQ